MKRILPILLLLAACLLSAAQVELTGRITDPVFESVQTTPTYTEFTFQLPACEIEEVDVDGVAYQRISHRQSVPTIVEGMPETPMFATLIGIPEQGGVEIELVDPQYTTIHNLNLYPSQGVHLDGETRGFARDEAFYNGATPWSPKPVTVTEPSLMRGVRVVGVNVNPVSYNPALGEATVMESATVRLRYTRDIAGNTPVRHMPRSRSFEKLYAGTILNWDDIRDESEPYQARSILVIHPGENSLNDLVNQFVDWKRTKGFEVASVSTGEAGGSNSQILNYIQNAYDTWENPPEYIVLIGDANGAFDVPTWIENWSYYNGVGDYPYTLLAGNDYLPDAFIGRISIEATNHMMTFLAKMNLVEREVYMDDPSLYHHSLLVGDTQPSGLSCIVTNKYVKEQLLMTDPTHTFTEIYNGSPSVNEMNNAINDGVLFFNYRGYVGMSNWSAGTNNNVNRLCNGTIITCSTGTFGSGSNAEDFVRDGTPSSPTGAFSAIGMSTSGTHTQFNNILQGGIFQGLGSEGMRDMGQALARGEVSMWAAYSQCALTYCYEFIHWINQIGDPSMDVWMSEPLELNANYDTSIPLGQEWIDVQVTDADDDPIEGAWVTARQGDDDIFVSGYTDVSGQVTLRLNDTIPGDVDLTVTKPDYIPHLGEFTIEFSGGVQYAAMVIDDDNSGDSQGNNNGDANPGEIIELVVSLKNWSGSTATGVDAHITSGSPYVSIIDDVENFGDIGANQTAECLEDFDIEILPDAPDRHEAMIVLDITDSSGNTYSDRMWLFIHGNDLDIVSYETVDGGNNVLDPGEQAPFRLTVTNNGEVPLTDVYADLYSLNGLVSEIDTMAYFGDIAVGATVTCTADPFEVYGMNELIPGMTIDLQITFFNDQGYEEVEVLHMVAGQISVTDAVGPDAYGYICFDQNDLGYDEHPTYEWVDISAIGEDTGIIDDYDEDDHNAWVELPFTFRFYGEEYDGVTISSNGWISFLETEQLAFRNWPVPEGLGPNAMIAVFWDDLRTNNGGVYTYYDEDNDCFVIQWDCVNSISSAAEKFQLLLYDPQYTAAPTGDGVFKMQYHDYNNVDGSNSAGGAQGNYCTVGIESPDGAMGLQYVYSNTYSPGAHSLDDGWSLFFTTIPIVYPDSWLSLGDIVIHDENGSGFIDAGESVELGVWLQNIGMEPSYGAFATIQCLDAYASVISDTSGYRFIDAGSMGVNRSYFKLNVSPGAPDGRELPCTITINNADGSWTYPFFLTVHKPTLEVYSIMINDIDGNNNGVMDPGETGQLIVNLRNVSISPADDIDGELTTDNAYVTIEQGEVNFGDLGPGEFVQRVFTVSVDADAPAPSSAWYDLDVDAIHANSQVFHFPMGIGDWGFANDFEADNGGLSPYGTWQWGEPSVGAHSGTKAWATALGTNYGNSCNWFVSSSAFFIGDNTLLTFWQYYDMEQDHDGGNVKISTNNGITWHVVEPVGGYPTASFTNSALNGEPGFSGTTNGWQQVTFDLSPYANDDIKLRWHFGSDAGTVGYGWAFDDIVVSGGTERSGIIHGTVSFDTANDPLEDIWVHAGDFAIHPDDAGDYTLYTIAGTFDLTGSLRWYEAGVIPDFVIEQGGEYSNQDLELLWLPEIDSLEHAYNEDTGLLVLSWTPPAGQQLRKSGNAQRQTADTSRYDYIQTNIWMQQETGPATMVDSVVAAETWQMVLDNEREYMFWVERQYDTGCSAPSNVVEINYTVPVDPNNGVPAYDTALRANYPNPFNPTTTIAFSLAQPGHAEVKVYNVRGQLVRTLANGHFSTGEHTVVWDGRDASNQSCGSGVYFFRLEAPGYTRTRKALMLK